MANFYSNLTKPGMINLPMASSAFGQVSRPVARFSVSTDLVAGDVVSLFNLPSSWQLQDIEVANEAITAFTGDIVLLDGKGNVIFTFESDYSFADAVNALTTVFKPTIDEVGIPVWQLAGQAYDPLEDYVVAVKVTAAPTKAGNIAGRLTLVQSL